MIITISIGKENEWLKVINSSKSNRRIKKPLNQRQRTIAAAGQKQWNCRSFSPFLRVVVEWANPNQTPANKRGKADKAQLKTLKQQQQQHDNSNLTSPATELIQIELCGRCNFVRMAPSHRIKESFPSKESDPFQPTTNIQFNHNPFIWMSSNG